LEPSGEKTLKIQEIKELKGKGHISEHGTVLSKGSVNYAIFTCLSGIQKINRIFF
jgi:hypothetical protein